MVRFALIVLALAFAVAVPFAIWGDAVERAFSRAATVLWLKGYGRSAWLAASGVLVAHLVLPPPANSVMAGLGPVTSGLVGDGLGRAFGQGAFGALPAVSREAERSSRVAKSKQWGPAMWRQPRLSPAPTMLTVAKAFCATSALKRALSPPVPKAQRQALRTS